jgi:hypothetical protein
MPENAYIGRKKSLYAKKALKKNAGNRKMVTRRGFEPLYDSVKGCCVKPLHQRARIISMVRSARLELARVAPPPPQDGVSANSTTTACLRILPQKGFSEMRAFLGERWRAYQDSNLGTWFRRPVLYPLSYRLPHSCKKWRPRRDSNSRPTA